MLIYQFHHYIKPEHIEAYKAAAIENARMTMQEPGVLRFDVLQDKSDPGHFCLFEIYADAKARSDHLETDHFKAYKQSVVGGEMFTRRGEGEEFDALFLEADWESA